MKDKRRGFTVLHSFFDHACGDGGLALSQRESMEAAAHA